MYRLEITDGTNTVKLAHNSPGTGFFLNDWRPALPRIKSGGYFQESSLATGRRLVGAVTENTIERFDLRLFGSSTDNAIEEMITLRTLLRKAEKYWINNWRTEPVYLVAKAEHETNTRYAIVYTGVVEDEEAPFRQPFLQPNRDSVWTDISLVIERGDWQSDVPGSSTALPVAQVKPHYTYDEWLGSTWAGDVDYWLRGTSMAALSTLTFGAGANVIIPNGLAATSHYLLLGFEERPIEGIQFNVTTSLTGTGLGSFAWEYSTTGGTGWSTSGMVIDDNVNFFQNVGFNGVNFFTNGRIATPALGNWEPTRHNGIYAYWIRHSFSCTTTTAATTVTGPPRGYITIPKSVVGAIEVYDDIPKGSTDGDIVIANHLSISDLSHIYSYDGSSGTYSSNLMLSPLPYALTTNPFQNGDQIYFGIATSLPPNPNSYFTGLIFDLWQASGTGFSGEWEYSDGLGGWPALTVHDTTNELQDPGFGTVIWALPEDWGQDIVNTVQGVWVRFTCITPTATGVPYQVDRHVYTPTKNYYEINSEDLSGDLPTLIKQDLLPIVGTMTLLQPARIFFGARSFSRAAADERFYPFNMFINATDDADKNFGGMTVTTGGGSSFSSGSTLLSPVNRFIDFPGGATSRTTWYDAATFTFTDLSAIHYRGRYRVFCRVGYEPLTDILVGAWHFRYKITSGEAETFGERAFSNPVLLPTANDSEIYNLIDLGVAQLPTNSVVNIDPEEYAVTIQIARVTGTAVATKSVYIYDLVLLPIDELYGYVQPRAADDGIGTIDGNEIAVSIDGTNNPRQRQAYRYDISTDRTIGELFYISPFTEIEVGANETIRIYFLSEGLKDSLESEAAKAEIVFPVQVSASNKYQGMRGSK